mgnify:CR=1 FL=1
MGMNYFITAQGFPFLGMATTLIGAVVNIVLDPIFIFVFHMVSVGLPLPLFCRSSSPQYGCSAF